MAEVMSIEELEATINTVCRHAPSVNGRLSPALCIFAELYGTMIYYRMRSIDIAQLTEETQVAVRVWRHQPRARLASSSTASSDTANTANLTAGACHG